MNVITCKLIGADGQLVRTTTMLGGPPDVITWRGRTFVRDMTTADLVEYVESPARHMGEDDGWSPC